MTEEQADRLIAAIEKLAGLGGGTSSGGGAAGGGTPSGRTSTATFEQVKTALLKVKDDKGFPRAKTIIKDVGKSDEMIGIKKPQFQAVLDECKRVLAEEEGGGAAAEDTL